MCGRKEKNDLASLPQIVYHPQRPFVSFVKTFVFFVVPFTTKNTKKAQRAQRKYQPPKNNMKTLILKSILAIALCGFVCAETVQDTKAP